MKYVSSGARKAARGGAGKAEHRAESGGRAGDQKDQGKFQKPAEDERGNHINGRPRAGGKRRHGCFDRLAVEEFRQRREVPRQRQAENDCERCNQLGGTRWRKAGLAAAHFQGQQGIDRNRALRIGDAFDVVRHLLRVGLAVVDMAQTVASCGKIACREEIRSCAKSLIDLQWRQPRVVGDEAVSEFA